MRGKSETRAFRKNDKDEYSEDQRENEYTDFMRATYPQLSDHEDIVVCYIVEVRFDLCKLVLVDFPARRRMQMIRVSARI